MPNHPTGGRLIFNAFQDGADADALLSAVWIVVFAIVTVLVARKLGQAYRSGTMFTSRSNSSTLLRTFVGRNSSMIIGATTLAAIAGILMLSLIVYTDWRRIDSGDYASREGLITQFAVASITVTPQRFFGRLTDPEPALHETDQLVVGGLRFLLHCDRNESDRALSIGSNGRCLNLAIGDTVQVDYSPVDETHYRSEPLRIRLLTNPPR